MIFLMGLVVVLLRSRDIEVIANCQTTKRELGIEKGEDLDLPE